MRQKSKVKALRLLKRDASPLRVRRALYELHGCKMKELSRMTGLTRATLSAVLNGHRRNRAAQEALAALWGVPPEEVFEDWTSEP